MVAVGKLTMLKKTSASDLCDVGQANLICSVRQERPETHFTQVREDTVGMNAWSTYCKCEIHMNILKVWNCVWHITAIELTSNVCGSMTLSFAPNLLTRYIENAIYTWRDIFKSKLILSRNVRVIQLSLFINEKSIIIRMKFFKIYIYIFYFCNTFF